MTGFVTKLSSAGLVYKHYGKEIVAAAMGEPLDSKAVETTWLAVYKYFMEAVDGIDNGASLEPWTLASAQSTAMRQVEHDSALCYMQLPVDDLTQGKL